MNVSYSFIIVTVQNSQDELKTTNHTTGKGMALPRFLLMS